jgi:nicotinamide riboside transporter PnuC
MTKKFWFRKRKGILSKDLGYGWIPISYEGYITTFLFILINILGIIYFGFPTKENSVIYFFITLITSIIIFSIIAKYKTRK